MIEIALFDILPSEWMLEQIIYYPPADPFNLNFQILQYESSYSEPNLGTIFFMFLSFLILVPLFITMAFFATDLKELRKHTSNLRDFLFWKGTIRFFTESYMEIMLASGLNIAMFASDLDYKGVYFANYFSITLFVLAVGLPLWILIFFWCNISKWEDEEFMNKYGPILEGTRMKYNRFEAGNTWIALMYPVLMLLRRIGFVITVVFFPEFTWLQMATTFTFIQTMWNYLIYFYPMEDIFTNRMEIFSELTNLVLMYHVLLFTDFVGDIPVRYEIGYSFIGFMALFISVHLFLMMRDTLLKCRNIHRRKQKKKRDAASKEKARIMKLEQFKKRIRLLKRKARQGG